MKKNSTPIPQHISDFLDWLEIEKGLSSKSQENYARFIKQFTDWLGINKLEHLKPHEFSPHHIWQYRVYLARRHRPGSLRSLKKNTQNYYLIALRSLLNYFAQRDILALPAEKIGLARDKEMRPVRFLTLEQLKKLFSCPNISAIQGLRDRAILEVFFSTGMRIAELVALNRDQIKARHGIKELELGILGKGGVARTIYFSERALYWLRKYLQKRTDTSRFLFVHHHTRSANPARLTARSIERMVKKYALRAGLPLNTTPHVMRHSFATDLLAQGVDLRTIQEFLGHRNIAATQIYTHVTSKKLREVHQKFHGGKDLKI